MAAYLGALISVLVPVHLLCLWALTIRRNDLADVAWGPGFVLAMLGAIAGQAWVGQPVAWTWQVSLVLLCVSVWAGRLLLHLGVRTWKKVEEDIRYKNMRANWGEQWKIKAYLIVFLLQGSLMLVCSLPMIQLISRGSQDGYTALLALGLLLWVLGFVIESVSDSQLKKFKEDPANKGVIMDRGLWSWSRHPNYFGEVLLWWGVFLMCLNDPSDLWTVISPLMITFLILKVSGVPMMEELMKGRPGYDEYVRKTSVFFPRPPRK